MAFTNGNLIDLCNLVRNSDLGGNTMTDAEWSSLITANSQKLFARLLGVPDLYQTGLPIERRGAELSRVITQKLKPFFVRETASAVGGIVDLSSKGMAYMLAVESATIYGRPIDELEASEVADRLSDSVVAPTQYDPAYEFRSAGESIMVYPSTLSSIVLKYYVYPTDAVVVHTVNSTTLLREYDSESSTETGWEENEMIEIAYMCLRDLGMNMERTDIAQYASQIVENE